MTVYFQGAEKGDFVMSHWTAHFYYATSASYHNTANSRTSMRGDPGGVGEYLGTTEFSASEFWTHFVRQMSYGSGSSWNAYFVAWFVGSTPLIGISHIAATTAQLRYWNGAAWVGLGNFYSPEGLSGYHYWDIYIKVGAPGVGEVRVYLNGVPVASTNELDTTFGGTVTHFNKVHFCNIGNLTNTISRFSEIIVADWNTIGSKLVTKGLSGAGSHSEWAGDYLSVDEVAEDTVFVTSDTANQRFSVDVSDFPALDTGESIQAVKVGAVAVKDLTGPQGLNFFARVGGVDYDVGPDNVVPASINALNQIFQVNPATGLAWDLTDLNGAEFGVRSRT